MHSIDLPSGMVTGVGGLPHRDAAAAATFALRNMDIPAIPNLPRRSPAEVELLMPALREPPAA
mgnify:CR=1 FL=1